MAEAEDSRWMGVTTAKDERVRHSKAKGRIIGRSQPQKNERRLYGLNTREQPERKVEADEDSLRRLIVNKGHKEGGPYGRVVKPALFLAPEEEKMSTL